MRGCRGMWSYWTFSEWTIDSKPLKLTKRGIKLEQYKKKIDWLRNAQKEERTCCCGRMKSF